MKENVLKIETAVFGGGCFWCTEAVFKMLKGVIRVDPGYSGGKVANPTYDEVCSGVTSHVECIRVEFNPDIVTYQDLLTVFFGSHDPTALNRQGNDVGEQYRSVIFYSTENQKAQAIEFINELNSSNKMGSQIVTSVESLKEFYIAENYHKDYYERNPDEAYCQVVINPKLERVVKKFGDLLKNAEVLNNE